jgi:hypothetical protein
VYKIQQAGISFIIVKLVESKKDCKSVTDNRIFPSARAIPSKSYYTKMTMPELWQNCSDSCSTDNRYCPRMLAIFTIKLTIGEN